jgi:predicted ribonuclease YlaK
MPKIFNLDNIQKLIEEAKPAAAIIIDTNIIINEPDFAIWKTSLDNPLFILPCMIKFELENMKNKPDIQQDAMVATKNIMELCREGLMGEGIFKDEQGWFINVDLPNQQVLESELRKLETLVRAFGQADTKLIMLAKELMKTKPDVPVIFATEDEKLKEAVGFMGIQSYLHRGFPMTGLEELIGKSECERFLLNWTKYWKKSKKKHAEDLL